MLKSHVMLSVITILFILGPILPAQADNRWLIDESRLASTDLKIVWQYNLPLSGKESPDRLLIFGNRLFSLSNRNYLTCLNRTDGNVIFSNIIADAGLPHNGLEYYKGLLMTLVGNKVVEVNTEFGTIKKFTLSEKGVTAPVVRNNSFYYYAGLDKRLHAIRADDKVQVFEAAAQNDSTITSVLAEEDAVVFATNAGNVICISADGPKKLWQFDAPKAVIGSVVHDANSMYIACRDTKIYCLESGTGHLLWTYQTQAILDAAPQAGKKAVYQSVPDAGVIALDKKNGKLLWQVNDGKGFLGEFGDKAYVLTQTGKIAAMDNTKGKQLWTIDLGQSLKYAINAIDSKIYVSDDKGRLACLEPIR